MKFGAHAYIFTDGWSDESLPVLDEAAALGAECVEVPVGDDISFTPELTKQRAAERGLDLTVGPGGLWPMECDLSSVDAANRAAGLAWHKKQVNAAHGIGAIAYCGCLYGHPGAVDLRRPSLDDYERIADGLRQLAEYGREKAVAIVLEPMSHFRTSIVNTPEQLMQLIDLAGHTNLAVALDTYHMVTEVRDYAEAIRTVGDRLWGMHACENDRGVPGGGLVPWDDVFDALLSIDFDGYVLMESYNSAIDGFAFGRGMFHDVCPDAVSFVRRGLHFLKAGLNRADAS